MKFLIIFVRRGCLVVFCRAPGHFEVATQGQKDNANVQKDKANIQNVHKDNPHGQKHDAHVQKHNAHEQQITTMGINLKNVVSAQINQQI